MVQARIASRSPFLFTCKAVTLVYEIPVKTCTHTRYGRSDRLALLLLQCTGRRLHFADLRYITSVTKSTHRLSTLLQQQQPKPPSVG